MENETKIVNLHLNAPLIGKLELSIHPDSFPLESDNLENEKKLLGLKTLIQEALLTHLSSLLQENDIVLKQA